LDILIQDELNHPSLIFANRGKHPYPIISLVHHLRCSELRPKWQNTLYRIVEKRYLESVDGFIFNSETTRNVVQETIHHEKPSMVAYPPTDQFGEPISKERIIRRAQTNPLRILFLGNVIRRKGLHALLEAVKRLTAHPNCAKGRREGSQIHLDVVGSLVSEPQYAKQMQRSVTVIGLSAHVTFHSSLDDKSLTERLRQAHVLVVPSSYEGYGIVYLEGMCFGLPAIGTTAGAAREIISDGADGFLVEPENPDALADKLKILCEKREVLTDMSLAARERYLRQPKWEESANAIREFLLKQIQEFSV
jgi:glycosyltransferase involved in cell wall biosynthesis